MAEMQASELVLTEYPHLSSLVPSKSLSIFCAAFDRLFLRARDDILLCNSTASILLTWRQVTEVSVAMFIRSGSFRISIVAEAEGDSVLFESDCLMGLLHVAGFESVKI